MQATHLAFHLHIGNHAEGVDVSVLYLQNIYSHVSIKKRQQLDVDHGAANVGDGVAFLLHQYAVETQVQRKT